MNEDKIRAPRNQTLTLSVEERTMYREKLHRVSGMVQASGIVDSTICGDLLEVVDYLPPSFADLIIIDPPYNQDKNFNGLTFSKLDDKDYTDYLMSWFPRVVRALKPTGSLYLCGDWKNSHILFDVMDKHLEVRSRITWQREKGRGAKANWKNATEDIWFGTAGKDYYFDIEAVKMKRRVIAPYRVDGKPKDWEETAEGNYRLTHPSNFWDDISIPYWSMPENTDHPTQKPEKLIAKLILASCPPGGIVFDPFLGSGTTSVVAKKLNRKYCGVEINEEYCCWAEKRLEMAKDNASIQGYSDGVFWERNTLAEQKKQEKSTQQKRTNRAIQQELVGLHLPNM